MFRFLAIFFSILALLVFAAATMIKRDKPARAETEAYPNDTQTSFVSGQQPSSPHEFNDPVQQANRRRGASDHP